MHPSAASIDVIDMFLATVPKIVPPALVPPKPPDAVPASAAIFHAEALDSSFAMNWTGTCAGLGAPAATFGTTLINVSD
jgi:hypothetical protein